LLAEIEIVIPVVVSEITSVVTKSLNAVDALLKQRPIPIDPQFVFAALFCGGSLAVFSYACCYESVRNDSEDVIAFLISFCSVCAALFFARHMIYGKKLCAWKGEYSNAVKVFEELRSKCLHEFTSADALYKTPQVSEAISKLASQ